MKTRTTVLVVAAVLVFAFATPAGAQGTPVELGTSLVGLMVNWDNGRTATSFGIPSSSFGLVNPGVYVSVFAGSHLAVEPQIGLIVLSGDGNTDHALNVAGQVDYFLRNSDESSPYVFGSVGVINTSGGGRNPKSFSGGVGYRKVLGDRLAIRFDGRITHFTEDMGNALVLGVSLGGLFGRR